VSKLHELFIVASLTAITLKLFQRRLLESRLPVGLLSGGYRVGDFPYLLTRPFLSALFSWRRWGVVFLAVVLLVNTLLSTVVGPASAILMVPETDWFPLPYALADTRGPFFYNMAADMTWPSVVKAGEDYNGCDAQIGFYAYWCPGGGFGDIWNWVKGWEISALEHEIELSELSGSIARRVLSSPVTFRRKHRRNQVVVGCKSSQRVVQIPEVTPRLQMHETTGISPFSKVNKCICYTAYL